VGKAWGLKTTLPQTPHSAGSLRHWVRPFFLYRASFRRAALLVSSLSPAETQKVLHQLAALSHDWNHSAY